jgi:EAL domain-containing protein (putative c-di-GMP-specific phosphodiesterase class I)
MQRSERLLGTSAPQPDVAAGRVDGLCRSLLEELPGTALLVFDARLCVVDAVGTLALGGATGAAVGRPVHQLVSPHAWLALSRHFVGAVGGRRRTVEYASEQGERFRLRFGRTAGPDGAARGHVVVRRTPGDACTDAASVWIDRIQDALERERFVLHAQPIVDLETGRRVQHELLVRMVDELGSVVAPDAFLPVAEAHGLVGRIDRWVVRRAAALAGEGIPVEINLSAASIGDPDLCSFVEREIRESGADPSLLVFEITETALLRHEGVAERFLRALRALGCAVALDDFGTGYGGFTYLKRLPVDFLKIDVEFVRELPRDPASRHVVEAVVALARAFGIQTIAEGVEDAATLRLLAELGVDRAQGFGICRPAPAAAILPRAPAG